jgi:hypothetical protein
MLLFACVSVLRFGRATFLSLVYVQSGKRYFELSASAHQRHEICKLFSDDFAL